MEPLLWDIYMIRDHYLEIIRRVCYAQIWKFESESHVFGFVYFKHRKLTDLVYLARLENVARIKNIMEIKYVA